MTGPEPQMMTFGELVELGAKAAFKSAIEGDDPDWSWEKADDTMKWPFLADARSILDAVLPRALEGAREALGWAIREAPGPCQDDDCIADDCVNARLARSVHSHIDSLLKGET